MPDVDLHALAYHAEQAAARRLALHSGATYDAALLRTLQDSAGGAPKLSALLDKRRADIALRDLRAADRERRRAAAQVRREALKHGASTPWRGWFDGSAWPNPGRCGIGALLTGPEGERIAVARAAGYGNSSEAEYRALILLLELSVANGADAHSGALTIYGDSKVVIDDVTGARVPAAALAGLRDTAQRLLQRLSNVTVRWIPRHRNSEADALSQQARGMNEAMNETHNEANNEAISDE